MNSTAEDLDKTLAAIDADCQWPIILTPLGQ